MTNDHEAGKVSELKPCPFCGGAARTFQYNGTAQATCAGDYKDCAGSDVTAPIAMWNRRAESQTVAVRDDQARALVRKYREIFPGDGWPSLGVAHQLIAAALEPTPIKETASPAVPADVQGVTDEMVDAALAAKPQNSPVSYFLNRNSYLSSGAVRELMRAALEAAFALSDYQRLAAENERLTKERDEAVDIAKAVAHIGVDFGYGPYTLDDAFIEQARTFLASLTTPPTEPTEPTEQGGM